jgi:hypothetical protein
VLLSVFVGAVIGFAGLDSFNLAYAADILFFAWASVFWLTLKNWEISKTHRKKCPKSAQRKLIARRAGVAGIAAFAIGASVWIRQRDVGEQLRARSGLLVPGNEPDLPNRCRKAQTGQLIIALGSQTVFADSFPVTVVRVTGERLLNLDRDADGNLLLSTDIYDHDHNIIASITNNKYDTDSSVFKVEREDLSSLTVYARKDKEKVLTVRYLNPHMIALTGVFRSTRKEVMASSTGVILDRQPYNMIGTCMYIHGKIDGSLFDFR